MVATLSKTDHWPNMGMEIRSDRILDGLKREYFPKQYQSWFYPGARIVTVEDFKDGELREKPAKALLLNQRIDRPRI